MAYEDAPPTDCTIEGDQARCPWGYDRFPSGPLPGRIAGLCTSSKVATVDVSLPASGDVAVDVPLR